MQPNLIRSTAESAQVLLHHRGYGSPEAFLLAWVAWEGIRTRILVVALVMKGWRVKDIYPELAHAHPDSRQYQRLFRVILGTSPQQIKGTGETWRQIEQFRKTRNAIAHGIGTSSPARLEAATHLIVEAAESPEWLARIQVILETGPEPLGDIYRRLSPRHQHPGSLRSLRELINAGIAKQPAVGTRNRLR